MRQDLLTLNSLGYALEQCYTSDIDISGVGTNREQCNGLLDIIEEFEEIMGIGRGEWQWSPTDTVRKNIREMRG